MDIKKKITEIVAKIKNDKGLAAKFKENPINTIKSLLGVDLPDDQITAIVEGVKAKLSVDKSKGILGFFKKIFGK